MLKLFCSVDSDLEAFSHNPADGSFAPLAVQPRSIKLIKTKCKVGYCTTWKQDFTWHEPVNAAGTIVGVSALYASDITEDREIKLEHEQKSHVLF